MTLVEFKDASSFCIIKHLIHRVNIGFGQDIHTDYFLGRSLHLTMHFFKALSDSCHLGTFAIGFCVNAVSAVTASPNHVLKYQNLILQASGHDVTAAQPINKNRNVF